MSILIYLIKTVLISGLLLGYYMLFLRNRLFHGFNRFYLLAIPVLGFLLPALHLSIPAFWNQSSGGSPIRLLAVSRGTFEDAITIYGSGGPATLLSLKFVTGIIYAGTCFFLLFRLFRTLRFLFLLRKNSPSDSVASARIYFVSAPGTPFSFFSSIFWDKGLSIDSKAGQQILRHEIFHVEQNHSLDNLIMEMLSILYWFNPFIYFIHRELRAIHEYTADAYAAAGADTYEYASLLLMKVSGSSISITHPFFKNQIKRRISMMTKKKNNPGISNRFMILPLLAFLVALFSFKMQNGLHLMSGKSMRVVIDAGHGGSFTGAQSGGMLEKNVNLLIAKKIQSLSKEYNVEVIMTRESDVTPGSNELRESLEYIAGLAKNKNADLFISIHSNATESAQQGKLQTVRSGFQIYIPRNSSEVYEGSLKLGSIMTDIIKADYPIESELKQTQGDGGNILILKKATVPAILIECGYIDNPDDQKILQDESQQEKIARDILKGISRYNQQNVTYNNASVQNENSYSPNELSVTAADSSAPLKKVEVAASFPGGQAGWYEFLAKNLKYPKEAIKNEIQGTVLVKFVVKADGTLTDIDAISGPQALTAESLRIIAASGKWVPARDHGVTVDSYNEQPIIYKLQ
jgi:TonB family protein